MQYTAINFTQKLPYFGKRDALSNKIKATKKKVALSLEQMKVKIVREIKITAYTIWEREEELKTIHEYMKLTKQNISLYSAFTSNDSKSHMSIMSAEMSLSELKIKQISLESSLKGLYKKISYFSEMKVPSVEMNMELLKPLPLEEYLLQITKNVSYKIKEASLHESKLDIKVKELDFFSDPVLKLGYYQRQSFEDYVSIGLAFKIPLYGTQDSHLEKSKKLSLSKKNELIDYNNLLSAQISKIHARLQSAYSIHKILMNESMLQIQHMFELSASEVKNGDELFIYIDVLEKKLFLEQKNITAVALYHKNKSRLDALIGGVK